MSLLYIVKYGYPTLREPAAPIEGDSAELQLLINDMIETMYDAPGVGLAAPQVGVGQRLFVMDPWQGDNDAEAGTAAKNAVAIINPEVLSESPADDVHEEGCLSLPGLEGEVYRPVSIEVKYLDRRFEPHEETLTGFAARVFQHEFDHLNGRLFTDLLPLTRRSMLGPTLMKIKREGEAALAELTSAGADASSDARDGDPPFRIAAGAD